jgi:hypothetical protein
MSVLAERLSMFEPLLDELMAVFGLEAGSAAPISEDPVFDAYHRCEVKRLKIGKSCEDAPDLTGENVDLIMHAIAHDHCPSGNRQLIEPLTAVLGPRKVMELVLDRLEIGSAAEKQGAAMAWYWIPRVALPGDEDIKALQREFEPRLRNGCLWAFVATDEPGDRLYLSYHFTLDPGEYAAELHPVVAMAARIAEEYPEQYRHGGRGQ